MATRSSRKSRVSVAPTDTGEGDLPLTPAASMSTTAGTPRLATSTPASASSSRTKSRSSPPSSPTRISRQQEKRDLQDLNNRLAAYIDRVRHLETENEKLGKMVEVTEEHLKEEIHSVKNLYDGELKDARQLVTDTSREKAQLQISVGKLKADNEELKTKLEREQRAAQTASELQQKSEDELADLTRQLQVADAEKARLRNDLKELNNRLTDVSRQLAEAKSQLEGEVLTRVDLENRAQGLKEELAFKTQMHETQMVDIQKRKTVEISEIDGDLKAKYEARMADVLMELREQYEEQLQDNKESLENIYETKLEELNRRAEMHLNDSSALNDTLSQAQSRTKELISRVSLLENTNRQLQTRISELENLLENERSSRHEEVRKLKGEIARLQQEMSLQLQEYQDLMDTKIALDMEITAYRKMLESEEERLNITPSRIETPLRGTKRKRSSIFDEQLETKEEVKSEASSDGPISITDEDPEGAYVTIHNSSDEPFALGQHELVKIIGAEPAPDAEEDLRPKLTYRFSRNFSIPAETSVSVYSCDSGVEANPPTVLIMKKLKWPVGKEYHTSLVNSDDEVIARRDTTTEVVTIKRGDERCVVM